MNRLKFYPDVVVELPDPDDPSAVERFNRGDYMELVREVSRSISERHRDFRLPEIIHGALEHIRDEDYPALYEYLTTFVTSTKELQHDHEEEDGE